MKKYLSLIKSLRSISTTLGIFAWTLLAPPLALADTLVNCEKITTGGIKPEVCNTSKGGAVGGIFSRIIAIILIAAALLAFIFLIIGGIRWILSGGDKEGTAKARSTLTAAIIGLAIVFLSFVIMSLLGKIFGFDLFNLDFEKIGIFQ